MPRNNTIEERIRDWIVDMPSLGFLFPAFNDRNTDLHSLLYYSKNAEELHETLIDEILGCVTPLFRQKPERDLQYHHPGDPRSGLRLRGRKDHP